MNMASRTGSLLEKNVAQICRYAGFNPELNKIYTGYEIDVFLKFAGFKIAFECKQYERSTLAIRNLIHQWHSKNKELNFNKIILVLIGCDIHPKDYELAKKYGIIIWDEKKLHYFLDLLTERKVSISKFREKFSYELGFPTTDKPRLKDKRELKKESIEPEITEQQQIMAKALSELLRRGQRHIGSIYFEEKGTEFFIQYTLDAYGFFLDFPSSINFGKEHYEEMRALLKSEGFVEKKISFWNRIFGDMELAGKEFLIDKDDGITAKLGEDVDFVAHVSDKIFRKVFKANADYKIKINMHLGFNLE